MTIREPLNLLLPLRLERRGRNHEHATGLAEPMQQRARGDGLNGLAQAHFVRQQRAFGEGQVQHAFALIREQRHRGLVRGPFAALHAQFVIAPQFFAFLRAAHRFQPRRDFLRDAQFGQVLPQPLQRRHDILRRTVFQHAACVEPSVDGFGQRTIAIEQSQ